MRTEILPWRFRGLALRPPAAGPAEQLPVGATPASPLRTRLSPQHRWSRSAELRLEPWPRQRAGPARNEPGLTGYSRLGLGEVVGSIRSIPQELTLGAPLTVVSTHPNISPSWLEDRSHGASTEQEEEVTCEPMQTKPRKAENVKEKSPPIPIRCTEISFKSTPALWQVMAAFTVGRALSAQQGGRAVGTANSRGHRKPT